MCKKKFQSRVFGWVGCHETPFSKIGCHGVSWQNLHPRPRNAVHDTMTPMTPVLNFFFVFRSFRATKSGILGVLGVCLAGGGGYT